MYVREPILTVLLIPQRADMQDLDVTIHSDELTWLFHLTYVVRALVAE